MDDIVILESIFIVLAAAIVVVSLFRSVNLSPILGYLTAGIIIGPHALGLIADVNAISVLAELGVAFLLFSIGLELTPDRFIRLWRYVFGLGLLQVIITGILGFFISYKILGVFDQALVLGGVVALSSTALCLQLLSENNERMTKLGQAAISILLLQDLAVVPMLALAPLFRDQSLSIVSALSQAGMKAAVSLALIFLFGKFVFKPIFRIIANTKLPELFFAATLLVVLGTAYLTHSAGLSLALGAFLAGLLVAETEFSYQVETDIHSFRGILLGLFFMTVGMGIDLAYFMENTNTILLILVALLVIKGLILFLLALLFRLGLSNAVRLAFLLGQGGEFAFILLAATKMLDSELSQLISLVVALSLLLTPLLDGLGKFVAGFLRAPVRETLPTESESITNHVIIAGFGRFGQMIAKILSDQNITYIALEHDEEIVNRCFKKGFRVYLSDVKRVSALKHAGIESARALIVAIDKPKISLALVHKVHSDFPDLKIFVRAQDSAQLEELCKRGASSGVLELVESSLNLSAQTLSSLGFSRDDISRKLISYREHNYAALLGEHFSAGTKNK